MNKFTITIKERNKNGAEKQLILDAHIVRTDFTEEELAEVLLDIEVNANTPHEHSKALRMWIHEKD